MHSVLHITHTNVATDSRILKEIASIVEVGKYKVSAIGVTDSIDSSRIIDGAEYWPVPIMSSELAFLPRGIRYSLGILEFTVRAVVKGLRARPKIIHCHDTFALPAGRILKALTDGKLVYDAHELESDKNGQTRALSRATLMIERVCWQAVDLLVTVSHSIEDWYHDNLGNKASIVVLNSPVFDSKSASTLHRGAYLAQHFGIPLNERIFLYLGLIDSGRGIATCLEVFANSGRAAHIVFMGSGRMVEEVIAYAKRYPNIHYHPAVKHDEVVNIAKSADYGVCLLENVSLSDYLCLPNKLFEYAFSGLPVLASRFPEISRAVDLYSLGVCCDPDRQSVARALAKVMTEPLTRVTSDLRDLSWASQGERILLAYDELMCGRRSAADDSPSTNR
jgi:glycosyltransferase involved in cell wall biosynthesis